MSHTKKVLWVVLAIAFAISVSLLSDAAKERKQQRLADEVRLGLAAQAEFKAKHHDVLTKVFRQHLDQREGLDTPQLRDDFVSWLLCDRSNKQRDLEALENPSDTSGAKYHQMRALFDKWRGRLQAGATPTSDCEYIY